jgi:hypothetical protein
MRKRLLLATLMIAVAAPAAQAQSAPDTGVRTETMERLAAGKDRNLPFNIIGLLGLLGLLGLRRAHTEDSYHPTQFE